MMTSLSGFMVDTGVIFQEEVSSGGGRGRKEFSPNSLNLKCLWDPGGNVQ